MYIYHKNCKPFSAFYCVGGSKIYFVYFQFFEGPVNAQVNETSPESASPSMFLHFQNCRTSIFF